MFPFDDFIMTFQDSKIYTLPILGNSNTCMLSSHEAEFTNWYKRIWHIEAWTNERATFLQITFSNADFLYFDTNFMHDDVIKRKHFPRYWPFVREIHRSPVNSLHKGQWRGALIFYLICARINGRVNNNKAGDLRRHRAHYDVIVMCDFFRSDPITDRQAPNRW